MEADEYTDDMDDDAIDFDIWIDENGFWTENPNPAEKVPCMLASKRVKSPGCEGKRKMSTAFGEADCIDCRGKGYISMPDKELNNPHYIEIYFRQLEIEAFQIRCEMEEERFGL
jgi:hypothetical protein